MTRKKFLLATASSVSAVSAFGGAHAADMALKAPPAPVATPSWAGWYVGASVGAAWERTTSTSNSSYGVDEIADGALPTSVRGTSFIGGGEIGYNWQSGNVVFGLEADLSGLGGSFSNRNFATTATGAGIISQMNWLSTVRARLGTTVGPDWLAYVTGGLAVGQVKNTMNFGDPGAIFIVNNKSVTKTRTGWTVGGGLEHMLTSHWIIGAEVLFVDLGTSSVTFSQGGQGAKTSTFHNKAAIGRLKLDYKF